MRLWPGIALVAVFWLVRVWASIGEFAMYKFFVGMLIAPLVVLVGLVLWWLLASRLRWSDRLLVVGDLGGGDRRHDGRGPTRVFAAWRW